MKSDDMYLNVHLPNGDSLQRKFTITETLKSVKNYVDENQTSELGSTMWLYLILVGYSMNKVCIYSTR